MKDNQIFDGHIQEDVVVVPETWQRTLEVLEPNINNFNFRTSKYLNALAKITPAQAERIFRTVAKERGIVK